MELHSIKIEGFFGRKEPVFIKFKDNKLIFLAENGWGKSTIMRILCYTLTCQFKKLNMFIFDQIIISINTRIVTIIKKQLNQFYESSFERFYIEMVEHPDAGAIRDYRNQMSTDKFISLAKDVFLGKIDSLHVPFRLRGCVNEIETFKESYLEQTPQETGYLKALSHLIKHETIGITFLYLPTYRSIESSLNLDKFNVINRQQNTNFEENVVFGMSDVKQIFDSKTEELKDFFDSNNKNIRQNNFLDILNCKYEVIDIDKIKNLTQNDIEKVISMISNDEKYKGEILSIIDKITTLGSDAIINDTRAKILYHIFLDFLDTMKQLDEKSNSIKQFVEVCNRYFHYKELQFDESEFTFNIELKNIALENENQNHMTLSSLSSGENQIVPLFCKLYLEQEDKHYFVLIDEPEISLSVGWQKMFLKDVIDSPKCVGLFAVTHSPFIFNGNGLEKYAFDPEDMQTEEEM